MSEAKHKFQIVKPFAHFLVYCDGCKTPIRNVNYASLTHTYYDAERNDYSSTLTTYCSKCFTSIFGKITDFVRLNPDIIMEGCKGKAKEIEETEAKARKTARLDNLDIE